MIPEILKSKNISMNYLQFINPSIELFLMDILFTFCCCEICRRMHGVSFKGHTKNIAIWGSFLTLSLIVYLSLSSGDFSFLLVRARHAIWYLWWWSYPHPFALHQTYSSFMRCFGFGLLNFKMWSSWSSKGISIKTLQLYILTFTVRLFSIMRHQGYLPFDKTGDWFYHMVKRSYFFMTTILWGVHYYLEAYVHDYFLRLRW